MCCLQSCINALSNWTGLKAIPALMPLCPGEDAVLLDVPSFSQTDDYSRGAIGAWSIVETFRPKADFWSFYCLVRPEPDVGVGPKRVLAAHQNPRPQWDDMAGHPPNRRPRFSDADRNGLW